jgi:long-chain acyl-CoA synthetase
MSVVVQFAVIPEMFRKVTDHFASETRPVLMYKADGAYTGISYSELRRKVDLFALGLASMGLRQGERVAIISENRPEWVISDMAVVSLGAVDVPVYPTMTAKQYEFILNDAGVKFVIVSNQFHLNKVIKILPATPSLKKIILMNEKAGTVDANTVFFSHVMESGKEFEGRDPAYLDSRVQSVRPSDLLTLLYTSGTTGNPKGVMLTHGNLASNILSAADCINIAPGDRILSFLPLCHSFERMAGYYAAMACGASIAYAESVETVRDNMIEVRPTIIPTVPRLFERIHNRILKQVDASSPLRRKIFHWAIRVGKEHAKAARNKNVPVWLSLRKTLAENLVFRKLRARTGGAIKFFISGGAALAREIGEFFEAAGLTIVEGYGLTETSPVLTVNRFENYRFGSVGQPIPGVELRIAADGEILARGPNIMRGYWNNTEATREAIDGNGWFHTGDIGQIDSEGFLCITDRKKHLFVSSGGKNIAPQPIESLFLSNKYIEQFVLLGDRRMFLTALIVPDFEALKEYADARKIAYSSRADLAKHREINQLMEQNIALIQKDLAGFERVRKFALLEKPFSIEEGELTPTQKVRRNVVEQRYAHIIEKMYEGIG